jgi:cytoskeletal protein CcmA (bactofilin family)
VKKLEKCEIKAFLGAGSHFEGKLSFDEVVRIDGRFNGEIQSSDTLIIGDTAEVEGSIEVGHLILSGKFKGQVVASAGIELLGAACVSGVLQTPQLKVADTVNFNGEIKMPSKETGSVE